MPAKTPTPVRTRYADTDKDAPASIGSFFLDSGAHSLYSREVIFPKQVLGDALKKHGAHPLNNKASFKYCIERGWLVEEEGVGRLTKAGRKHLKAILSSGGYDYYESEEFYEYVDTYARFIIEHKLGIDFYVNVDAIFNPEISYKVQKYLEDKHGLSPLPVIHYGTDLKWIQKYLSEGYDYIGLGGLGQEVTASAYTNWADKVYDMICTGPKRTPIVKTHGFAMTAYWLLVRYPWYSVDSASWTKAAGWGRIYVPRKRQGQYTYDAEPYTMAVSVDSPSKQKRGANVLSMCEGEAKTIKDWLKKIDVPFGKVDKDGELVEWGVISHHGARKIANLRFFEGLVAWLPEWPWSFKVQVRKGFF